MNISCKSEQKMLTHRESETEHTATIANIKWLRTLYLALCYKRARKKEEKKIEEETRVKRLN